MEASDSSEVVDVFIVPNRFTSDSFSFCDLYTQHISDWFPTILAAAGITVDSLGLKYSLDGISHWDGITGRLQADDVYFGIRQDLYYGYDCGLRPLSFLYRDRDVCVVTISDT